MIFADNINITKSNILGMQNKFFIETEGPEKDKLATAIKYAIYLAKKDNHIQHIVLYSYTKQNFMQVDAIFGHDIVTEMFKKPIVFEGIETPFKCETRITYEKNKNSHNSTDIVIACHTDADILYKLDDYRNVKYIISVPWIMENTQPWINRWNASEILPNGNIKPSAVSNERTSVSILDIALEEMDINMFRTKSLSHKSDEETCKTYIRTINKYLPYVTPDELANKLVTTLLWSSKNAEEASELLNRLKSGKTFKGGQKTGLQEYFKRWKRKLE